MRTEKVGRVRTCRVEPAVLRIAEQWLTDQRTVWEQSYHRLAAYLATHPEQPSPRTSPVRGSMP